MAMSDIKIHKNAIVETNNIGDGTRVWAFAHILPGAVIGSDCNICDHVFIENDVIIGDRVTVKSGVQLWDSITINDDVFIGPNATFTNDRFPRSKQYLEKYPRTVIHKGASIGANSTVLPGIKIGRNAMVGAGAVVINDVPPHAVVVGNPARITGYSPTLKPVSQDKSPLPGSRVGLSVQGVELIELPLILDMRGNLSVGEYSEHLPFLPRRYFLVFDVPTKDVRGEHAHKELEQFLVCVKGSCAIVVDDGEVRAEITLDRPNLGLYLPPMIWGIQYKFTRDAVLLVLASDIYKAEDYVRDYEDFLTLKAG